MDIELDNLGIQLTPVQKRTIIDHKKNTWEFLKLVNDMNNEILNDYLITNEICYKIDKLYYKWIFALTQDQQIGCNKLLEFLYSDKPVFGFFGYSGTGKTTIVNNFVKFLLNNTELVQSVVLSAPTNKAVNVIKQNYDNIKRVNDKVIDFLTIHQLFNIKPDYSDDGDKVFCMDGKKKVRKYSLIVIDECSMLTKDVIQYIMTNKQIKCKILFCGDMAQLPPVNEKTSMIFSSENKSDEEYVGKINSMEKFVMSQVVRNKSNVLLACNMIRNWVVDNIPMNMEPIFNKENCYAFKSKSQKYSDKENTKWFKKCLADKSDRIILCWTNKQCDRYNNQIRNDLFNGTKLKYVPNEKIIFNNFYLGTNESGEVVQKNHTSQHSTITSVSIKNVKFDINIKNNTILDNYIKQRITSYKTWILISNYQYIYVVHDDDLKKFNADILDLKYFVVSNKFTDHWDEIYSQFIDKFADISYGYSITTHKSQGSTFYNVYVDVKDIMDNRNIDEMKKCLYTAVSRCSNELNLLL